ncbi:MAG: tetratricopeptide repeat protein [Woeseiaceae bacterium]|nr:tetratricopeptide repeat protein [Woeseiaceae bacterium]
MSKVIKLLFVFVFLLYATSVLGDAKEVQKGIEAYNIGDYAACISMCMPDAEKGDPVAQFCVGRLYANGFGVDMNDAEALKWYGLSAEGGYAPAQFNLGVMHANGWGVPMNDIEAARLYRLAAEQGFLPAINGLAYVNSRGIGIEKDVIEGFMWYEIGVQLGDLDSVAKRDLLAEKMAAEDIAAATAKATAWMETHPKETLHAGIE